MRRKIRYKLKRTPKGYSLYTRGGTKYVWGKQKIGIKRILSAR